MSRKAWLYITFFILLFVGFYITLTQIIPGYGKASLPVLNDVQPFAFRDQTGKVVTNKDLEGKVYVAEFFFTTCKGICPKMNANLKKVYEQYNGQKDFRILSHTVDPGTDSVARMRRYADSLGVNPESWLFLTGSKDSLYRAARTSYLLDDPKNGFLPSDQQFIHTQFFALVDRSGQVRKIYDGLKKDELIALQMDIARLLKERPGNSRLAHSASSANGY